MPERKLIERLTDAVTSFRDPLPTKILGDIETKSDRPDFGRGWTDYLTNYRNPLTWPDWNRKTGIDYKHELGDLRNASLIMAIVNWTGINLAEALPIVTKPDSKGVPQIDLGHEAADLIRRPNPFHIWADYCQAGAFDLWMGNWYLQKVRNDAGQLIELWHLPQFLVEPRWPFDGRSPEVPLSEVEGNPYQAFISHYQYDVPGKSPILIKRSDMFHSKRGVSSTNARKGEGVWDSVLEEVYGDGAVARFSATIMKNMGMVQYLLAPKDPNVTVDPDKARHIKQQWIAGSTGANANTPMVNPLALDVTKLSYNPRELDLKELRNVPESRVAGVTGIPAIVLQFLVGLEHGHYGAAYEQARQQGYENVIIPIQNHISEDLTWQVLPEIDKTKGARLTFDISKVRVLQEDRDALYKRESEALRSGGVTVDQYLSSLGKDTLGPPLGDIRFVPSTSTPMSPERLIEASTTTPPPVPQPIDPASLAKFADLERWFDSLESQMKGFTVPTG